MDPIFQTGMMCQTRHAIDALPQSNHGLITPEISSMLNLHSASWDRVKTVKAEGRMTKSGWLWCLNRQNSNNQEGEALLTTGCNRKCKVFDWGSLYFYPSVLFTSHFETEKHKLIPLLQAQHGAHSRCCCYDSPFKECRSLANVM